MTNNGVFVSEISSFVPGKSRFLFKNDGVTNRLGAKIIHKIKNGEIKNRVYGKREIRVYVFLKK